MRQPSLHQRLRQFECNTGPAQRLTRILTGQLIRIDHSKRARQPILSRQVMVSDYEVHASATRTLGRGKCPRPSVHADHQPNTRSRRPLNNISTQVVALANAVGNVEVRRAPTQFNRGFQNHDSGRPVHVVVAIDENSLFAFDGRVKPIHGGFHSGHQVWRVQMSKRRREERQC